MHEHPVPGFRAIRTFSKLALFAALGICILLSELFPYRGPGSLVLSVAILGLLLLYAEVLKNQIIEAVKGDQSRGSPSGKPATSGGEPSGDKTQKERS